MLKKYRLPLQTLAILIVFSFALQSFGLRDRLIQKVTSCLQFLTPKDPVAKIIEQATDKEILERAFDQTKSNPSDSELIPKKRSVQRDELSNWINAHTTKDGKNAAYFVAELLLKSYVPHAEFESALLDTMQDFLNHNINEKQPLVIFHDGKNKSGYWCIQLLQRHGMLEDVSIIDAQEFFNRSFKSSTTDIPKNAHILIIDDASYSGVRISYQTSSIYRSRLYSGHHISVVVPFATQRSIDNLLKNTSIDLFYATRIPTILEALDKVEDLDLKESIKRGLGTIGSISIPLTYFDHKIPDHYSFPIELRNPRAIGPGEKVTREFYFLPEFEPPYKRKRNKL